MDDFDRRATDPLCVAATSPGAPSPAADARSQRFGISDGARRATNAALRQSEQRFAAVFHTSRLGIGISRLNGAFVEINDAMLKMYGYAREEVIGRTALELGMWVDPERRQWLLQRMRQEGKVNDFEMEFRRKDGSIGTLLCDVRIVPLDGQDHMIGMVQDISEQKRLASMMQSQAYLDPLTQLANRRHLHERLATILEDCRAHARRAGLMLIDLDHFKAFNDAFGHVQGDRMLIEVARRLDAAAAPQTLVARFGGDEFVLLIEDLDDAHGEPVSQMRHLSERIRVTLGGPYPLDESAAVAPGESATAGRLSASIGVTLITGKESDAEMALRHADLAMYRAKREGRDCVRFFVGWRLQDF